MPSQTLNYLSLIPLWSLSLCASMSLLDDKMTLSMYIENDSILISMTGPGSTWFGVGFNATMMDGTYSIIASSSNASLSVEEWILGDHKRGNFLNALDPEEDILAYNILDGPNSTRTIHLELPLIGTHFTFPENPDVMDIIISEGAPDVLEYAEARAMGTYEAVTFVFGESGSPTLEPTIEPTMEPTLEPIYDPDAVFNDLTPAPTKRTKPEKPSRPIITTTSDSDVSDVTIPGALPLGMELYGEMILDSDHGQSIAFYKDPLFPNEIGIVMTGPASVYYAVGFGHHVMDGTYAIVVDGFDGTVTERVLSHHRPGYSLVSSLSVMVNTVHDNIRTVAVLRETTYQDCVILENLGGVCHDFSSFLTDCQYGMKLIFARGSTAEFAMHQQHGSGLVVHGECPAESTSTEFPNDLDRDLTDEDGVRSSVSFGTMMVAFSLVLHVVL